ncbi:MAG: hypothetical protein ABSB89_00150 [Candidatus Bathyarchaeia archaeon]|jgi:hypothetical protein
MGFRLYLLAFSAYVCILTAASLAVTVYERMQYFLMYPVLVFGWVFAFAIAFDYLVSNQKLSWRKLLVLVFGLIIASSGVTHAVYVIDTPKWSFTVSTGKSVYAPAEGVHITVTVTNLGYISHSFSTIVDPSIIVEVWSTYYEDGIPEPIVDMQMWFTAFVNQSLTTLTFSPGQSLTRTVVWNQTLIHPESSLLVKPGTYLVDAFIPDVSFYPDLNNYLAPFWAETFINVTSTG